MKFVQEVEKLQKENEGLLILAKNGIFFVAIGKDAIILNEELGLKVTCMRKELCKVGFLVKNVEKYIAKLDYSFILYVKNEKDELEEIYRYKGKNTKETKNCLECTSCASRKEQEEDILERVRNLGKAK